MSTKRQGCHGGHGSQCWAKIGQRILKAVSHQAHGRLDAASTRASLLSHQQKTQHLEVTFCVFGVNYTIEMHVIVFTCTCRCRMLRAETLEFIFRHEDAAFSRLPWCENAFNFQEIRWNRWCWMQSVQDWLHSCMVPKMGCQNGAFFNTKFDKEQGHCKKKWSRMPQGFISDFLVWDPDHASDP